MPIWNGEESDVTQEDGSMEIMDGIISKRTAGVAPGRNLMTAEPVRLVGTPFVSAKNPDFWTETVTGTGAITVNGEADLATGTDADSTVQYETVQQGRFVVGVPNVFKSTLHFATPETADNVRRIGAYDSDDGFYFQLDGSTFSIGSRQDGVDSLIESGSFNGDVSSYTMDTGVHKVAIEISMKTVTFIIDGTLIHNLAITHGNKPYTYNFPVTIENNNYNSSTSDVDFHIAGATIHRIGRIRTESTYEYIDTDVTSTLKYGAGDLHRVVVTSTSGEMTLYDNTSAAAPEIGYIDAGKTSGTMEFNAPFSDGLTVVTSGGPTMTVVYE